MSDASDHGNEGQGAQDAASSAEKRARRQERLRRLMGGPQAAGAPGRQAAIERLVKLLTDTPADGAGMVPGTSFTQAGVAAFLAQLNKRSANVDKPGGKVAKRLLSFLEPGADESEGQVQGVSVKKLQRVSQLSAGALRMAAGGGRQGAGQPGAGQRRNGGALGAR